MSSSSSTSSDEELYDDNWGPCASGEPLRFTPSAAHKAVLNNDVIRLQQLVNRGHSMSEHDMKGNTPLHWAIAQNKFECFNFLVNHKDTVLDATNFQLQTPLFLAAIENKPHYALALIKNGADVNNVTRIGKSPLNLTSNALVAQQLILKGVNVNYTSRYNSYTPIFDAVRKGALELFDCLLFYGGDVTIPNIDGTLPFFFSPPEIEETLFELTFDSLELYEVRLRDILMLIEKESPFFYRLLELTSAVKWDTSSHLDWKWRLFDNENKLYMLLSLLDKFKDVTFNVMQMCNPLKEMPTNIIEILCALDESYACELMIDNFNESGCCRDSLLRHDWMEFIFYLLSKGLQITQLDMDFIYKHDGFNELFELLLHMEILPEIGVYAPHIYDPNYSVSVIQDTFTSFFHQDEGVPSLMELSREVARRHLVSFYGIKSSGMFLAVLKCLPIPKLLQDVLCYKQAIY